METHTAEEVAVARAAAEEVAAERTAAEKAIGLAAMDAVGHRSGGSVSCRP